MPTIATYAHAQTVLSSNDGHTQLENGVQILPTQPLEDTVSRLQKGKDGLWSVVESIEAGASVVGPPTALTISPDGHYAYSSSAAKQDAQEKKIVPNNIINVIDLRSKPMRIVQTVQADYGATTLRLSPNGNTLLVANGKSGSITYFQVNKGLLSAGNSLKLPVDDGFVGGVIFAPDGRRAFLSMWKGDCIYTLKINGNTIKLDTSPISVSPGAWTLRITPDGHYMSVNVLGHGTGQSGAIALFDLTTHELKETDRVTVPNAPEGTDISPDGRYLAVVSQNGSAMPYASPLYNARGIVTVFAIQKGHLKQLAQAPGPLWPQGLVFSPDGKEVLSQGGADHKLRTMSWNGKELRVLGDTDLPGAGANLERSR
ncbi:hypothetical protein AA106555_0454 [Neokomagataea thailandica NBRC 106555]|uniref:Uncharacterized protein n=1 Tax=Neokomagataea thailandica NBRC 106555 TaxID=1223520 RepID=A0ABQ0QN70_9PROT|nr:hypothetical protein AA106555_0454 [Neokomagataea thailandica NBRC 106555]